MSDTQAYRLYKSEHAETAMTGYGSKRYGGRWNSVGMAVVYCSSSLSLAQLEVLVHLRGAKPPSGFEYRKLTIPTQCRIKVVTNTELDECPIDWRSHPPHVLLQEIGDIWIDEGESAVMEIPSVVSPEGSNYLLNPNHSDFGTIRIDEALPLEWDERLFDR